MTAVPRADGPTQPPEKRGTGGGEAVASALDPSGELRSAASDCVHCGFCLPACPTYQLWGEEMDSPRGRIHLISQVLDGAPVSEKVTMHLDRCRLARKHAEPVSLGMTGQIDQDVDSIGADLSGEAIVGPLRPDAE